MIRTAGAVLAGAGAALRAPWWIEGPHLSELLRPPSSGAREVPVPRGATGAAARLLAVLARLPGSPWRNTCLYRGVAECLVLRRYGVPALLRIGVKPDGSDAGIAAHAWVVRADRPSAEPGAPSPEGHLPLSLRA